MAQVKSTSLPNLKCLGLYRTSFGFEDSKQQISEIKALAQKLGLEEVSMLDISTLVGQTPDKLITQIRAAKADVIMLWRLDCLPPKFDLKDVIDLFGELSRANIIIHSIRDNLDSFESGLELLSNLDVAWKALKKSRKVENARSSSIKAKAHNRVVGRKRLRNDDQIRRLRKEGLTIREIADHIGLSTTAVQRSLAEKAPSAIAIDRLQTEV